MTVMPMPTPSNTVSTHGLDIEAIRADFPILSTLCHGVPLVYLDNGATTQKPKAVIDRITHFYQQEYGTVRRGIYELSAKSTAAFDLVRQQVAEFLNAPTTESIIFTKGTTEAINLVAHGYGRLFVKPGDNIVVSCLEHHANLVPWQQLCLELGAELRIIPADDAGVLDQAAYEALLDERTRLVAVAHVSNVLGTIHPVAQMAKLAHAKGSPILVDGAQGAPHMPVDVQALDCDFYAFSGHKTYGPSGVGVLYGRLNLLEQMQPYQFGGDMIESVSLESTTFAKPPHKFEAGTPPIAQVIGLGAAIEYLQHIGLEAIEAYEHELLTYATKRLAEVDGCRIIGQAPNKASLVSFVLRDVHPHDVATLLDQKGIAVRAGHHCAQPVMTRYGVSATTRASFAFYNTPSEIDALVTALQGIVKLFQ